MPKTTRKVHRESSKKANRAQPGPTKDPLAAGDWELDLPAGFTADGFRMATLREVLDPKVPTRSVLQLSDDHRFDLAAKRIEMAPESFKVVIPGYGTIGKARAVAEVRGRSRIGRHLAEIQYIGINRAMKTGQTRP
jgi:hypothetical protein